MKEKRKRKGEFILNIRKKKIGGSIRGDVIKRVSDNAVYKARNDSRNIKVWEGAGTKGSCILVIGSRLSLFMLLKVINLSKRPPWMVGSGWIMSGRIHRKLFLSIKSSIPRLFAPPESNDASASPFNDAFRSTLTSRSRDASFLSNSSFRRKNWENSFLSSLFPRWRGPNLKEKHRRRGKISRQILLLLSWSEMQGPIENDPPTPPSKLDPPRVVAWLKGLAPNEICPKDFSPASPDIYDLPFARPTHVTPL